MSDNSNKLGSVAYHNPGSDYFEKRGLKRYAGVWSLWALGVGAVISGDFFGWNFGIPAGGFGGLLIATIIIAVMYIGMAYSLAELSPALPHTGGAYSFGRTAMGPWGGFVTGLAENMEYVLTPAVIVVGIASYMSSISMSLFGFDLPQWAWWAIFYVIFVGMNIWGIELTFRFTVFITIVALAILLIFWVGAIPLFSWDLALNVPASEGHSTFLPFGWAGVAVNLPFAIWFFLAIEQLPLAAEESHSPERDMPKGLIFGIATLVVAAFLTLFLNAGISPGAAEIGKSSEPLFAAFKTIFGDGVGASLLALAAVAGLVASFHTIIFAYGRNIYSLSRAGYFPHWLSVTHGTRKTPHVALIAGAVLGFIVCLILQNSAELFGDIPVGAVLLNMAVFGAVIAYVLQMVSFIILRSKLPNIPRPYVSIFGIPGAAIAAIIAAGTLIALFANPDYRVGIYGVAAWYVAGLLYFALYGRRKLVYSPEEEFAVKHILESKST